MFQKPGTDGTKIAELSVKVLELNERQVLFGRKVSKLKDVMNLMERILAEDNRPLRSQLKKDLRSMAEIDAEYSAMVKAFITEADGPQDNPGTA